MIRIYFIQFCFILTLSSSLFAQQFAWMQNATYSSKTIGDNVQYDSKGDIYVCGHFGTPGSGFGSFLSKYSSSGIILWTDTLENVRNIFMDVSDENNVFIVGNFIANLTLGHFNFITGSPYQNGFIAKYDELGVCYYARSLDFLTCKDIECVKDSYVIIGGTGGANHPTNLDGIIFDKQGSFVAFFDETNLCRWASATTGTNYSSANLITVDLYKNIYVSGEFYTSVTFTSSNNTISHNSTFLRNYFINKYSFSGNLLWSNALIPTNNQSGMTLNSLTDIESNVYLTGSFGGSIGFNGNSIVHSTVTPASLVVNYDSLGNVNTFKVFGNTDSHVEIMAIKGFENDIYLTGAYTGNVDFGGQSVMTDGSNNDLFICKYNSNLDLEWIHTSKGLPNIHLANGQSVGQGLDIFNDKVVITGSVSGRVSFDNILYDGDEYRKIYVTQLDETVIGINDREEEILLSVYPNPTGDQITLEYKGQIQDRIVVKIKNQLGEILFCSTEQFMGSHYKKEIDFSHQAKGVYFIELLADDKRSVKKVVLQ